MNRWEWALIIVGTLLVAPFVIGGAVVFIVRTFEWTSERLSHLLEYIDPLEFPEDSGQWGRMPLDDAPEPEIREQLRRLNGEPR